MRGWRLPSNGVGLARRQPLYGAEYREGFAMECLMIKKVREEIGMDNIIVMIQFCRR
jgi:pyruvate,water dikinase